MTVATTFRVRHLLRRMDRLFRFVALRGLDHLDLLALQQAKRGGMRLAYEAPFLRHFTAHLEPLSQEVVV